ncbi:MAG TPA: alpha/beta fold hydrolase [Acidimicrobiia bacterium]|nr:alpha/beta fold hydrolase [Acidimicrobiia bacterium]
MERRTISVHGHQVAYRTGGEGPVVLLVHGMAGSSTSWKPVLEDLGREVTYVAPDLPGHGRSDKPRGDYSLGAQAGFLRDLLAALGHERATVVGTSLGGGIAMQFAYQHPERCERLALVCAGGLGEEVTPLLRVLAAPGVDLVMPLGLQPFVRTAVETVTGWFAKVGLRPAPATREVWRSYTSLLDPETRTAFVQTLRAVVDLRGQRVSAMDKLYLAEDVPTLIVWGADDPIIPVTHAYDAHEAMPGSRLEIIEGCGHFPYVEHPRRFAEVLLAFVSSTDPVTVGPQDLARRLHELAPLSANARASTG